MTARVATVLSAREWEGGLVAHARETAQVRLVMRAYQPEDVERGRDDIDVVVAGAETAWVTPAQIAAWRRDGLRVVGIYPVGDMPARDMLEAGGAHELLPDDTPAAAILQAIRFLRSAATAPVAAATGQVVAVTGARGAPGRTEVALALAWNWAYAHRTVLIDLDVEAPAVAVRLGRTPRPDLTDVADAVRATGEIPRDGLQKIGPLALVVGSHRPGEPPLRPALAEEVVEAAAGSFERVVLDLGPAHPDDRLVKRADHAVLVADAGPSGIVRAARVAAEWSGPPPGLILNRVSGKGGDAVAAARKWTGLDPVAAIPAKRAIGDAARSALPPHRSLRRRLRRLRVAS